MSNANNAIKMMGINHPKQRDRNPAQPTVKQGGKTTHIKTCRICYHGSLLYLELPMLDIRHLDMPWPTVIVDH